MGLNFNFDGNKAIDQVSDVIKTKSDKKTIKDATSVEGIVKEFFKDTSYDFNVFYDKLITAGDEWILPDDCADELIDWQFVKINNDIYTPIQDRENSSTDCIEYRIKPSFYEAFKSYFDEHIRPDM